MINIEEFAHRVLEKSKVMLVKNKRLPHIAFIFKGDKEAIFDMGSKTDTEKLVRQAVLREIALKAGADAVVVVHEAWLAMEKMGTPVDLSRRVSERPDRKETIIVTGVSKTGDRILLFQLFHRKGKKITLEKPERIREFTTYLDDIWSTEVKNKRTH